MKDYTNVVKCKCYFCHNISMEKLEIDYNKIRADMQMKYNEGFNDGYQKAKEEMRKKLDL